MRESLNYFKILIHTRHQDLTNYRHGSWKWQHQLLHRYLQTSFKNQLTRELLHDNGEKPPSNLFTKKATNPNQWTTVRPVSLTSIISKLIEHIIHSQIMDHSDRHQIITSKQHGFWAKHSTESQLILTIHDISSALEEGNIVQLVILELTKAFDKVPHEHLLSKIHYYGIQGPLLNWIRDFLTKRS